MHTGIQCKWWHGQVQSTLGPLNADWNKQKHSRSDRVWTVFIFDYTQIKEPRIKYYSLVSSKTRRQDTLFDYWICKSLLVI